MGYYTNENATDQFENEHKLEKKVYSFENTKRIVAYENGYIKRSLGNMPPISNDYCEAPELDIVDIDGEGEEEVVIEAERFEEEIENVVFPYEENPPVGRADEWDVEAVDKETLKIEFKNLVLTVKIRGEFENGP